jgi:hypothetical protein
MDTRCFYAKFSFLEEVRFIANNLGFAVKLVLHKKVKYIQRLIKFQ